MILHHNCSPSAETSTRIHGLLSSPRQFLYIIIPMRPPHKFGALPVLVADVQAHRLSQAPERCRLPHHPRPHVVPPPPPPFYLVVPVGPSPLRPAQIYCAVAAGVSRLAAPCGRRRDGRRDEDVAALLGARLNPLTVLLSAAGALCPLPLPLPAHSFPFPPFASPLRCYQAVSGWRRLRWLVTGVAVVPAGGPPRDHVTHRGRPRRLSPSPPPHPALLLPLPFLTVPPPPAAVRACAHTCWPRQPHPSR